MPASPPTPIDPLLDIEERVVAVRDTVLFLAAQAEILDRRDLHRQLTSVKDELSTIRVAVHTAKAERARLRHKIREANTRGRF